MLKDFVELKAKYSDWAVDDIIKEIKRRQKNKWSVSHLKDYLLSSVYEIIEENVKLEKREQERRDINRIKNKSFREYSRIENAVSKYAEEIKDILVKQGEELGRIYIPNKIGVDSNKIGVIQLSDIHGNELIDLPHNKYDFTVLSKRLQKLANEAKIEFKARGVNKVLLAFTGDLLNSDRRLDELLNQATNRAKASVLMVQLFKHFILDLRNDFKLEIVGVLGNESRVNKDMSFSNNVLSDNYDFTILAFLRLIFEHSGISDIKWISLDKIEEVVNIAGENWLITHDYMKLLNSQKDVQSAIGRYTISGINIDYIIGGHIHSTSVSDLMGRSASMSGSNEYNEKGLNLIGRASQNIYVVDAYSRHRIAVDLQNTVGNAGYNVIKELEEYNVKSVDKLKPQRIIHEIVI